MSYEILTYQDAIDSCIDFAQGHDGGVSQQLIRRAINQALRTCTAGGGSDYLITRGRLHLVAAQTTGTVAYDNTTRQVTLTGATWPTWAVDASIKIGDVVSDVASRDSSTVITLDTVRNFGEDIAAGASYRLYKTCYHLPADFNAAKGFYGESMFEIGNQLTLEEYFKLERMNTVNSDTPRYYAFGGVNDLYGTLGLYVWPEPAEAQTYDYLYERNPRQLAYSGYDARDMAGTVVISGTSVTGTNTTFASGMAGSILRISSSSTAPSGRYGTNPFVEERVIASVTDATHLTLDAAATARSGVKCIVTDPIDLDRSWWDAFLARCHYEMCCIRKMDERTKADTKAAYEEKRHLAKCAANRGGQSYLGPLTVKRRFTLTDV